MVSSRKRLTILPWTQEELSERTGLYVDGSNWGYVYEKGTINQKWDSRHSLENTSQEVSDYSPIDSGRNHLSERDNGQMESEGYVPALEGVSEIRWTNGDKVEQ